MKARLKNHLQHVVLGTNTDKVKWQTPPAIGAAAELGHVSRTFLHSCVLYLLDPH